jgi:CRISPR-associated protein Csh2
MNHLKNNSDFLFLFQATLTNPNGDPDQENKPRMDYETKTLLVSDARRKRDCRDFLKRKGFSIFVDTLEDKKVPMDVMFDSIKNKTLKNSGEIEFLFKQNSSLKELWIQIFKNDTDSYFEIYNEYVKNKKDLNKDKNYLKFNDLFLTELIKNELIDVRLFGSAMAIEGISKTYTGPIQIGWGYSLHPVELVKSSTITSIMNDDNSTFGKNYKIHYGLIAHYGVINKYSAEMTGMTEKDKEYFGKAIVQGMINNQTCSKQGQDPLLFIEIEYKESFDGYIGDLRRFINIDFQKNIAIRQISDLKVDFTPLANVINNLEEQIERIFIWQNPFQKEKCNFINLPSGDSIDLLATLEK